MHRIEGAGNTTVKETGEKREQKVYKRRKPNVDKTHSFEAADFFFT